MNSEPHFYRFDYISGNIKQRFVDAMAKLCSARLRPMADIVPVLISAVALTTWSASSLAAYSVGPATVEHVYTAGSVHIAALESPIGDP